MKKIKFSLFLLGILTVLNINAESKNIPRLTAQQKFTLQVDKYRNNNYPLGQKEVLQNKNITQKNSAIGEPTYTYLRCWYRVSPIENRPESNYEWARDETGNYYKLPGVWWDDSFFQWKNMFYTSIPSVDLKNICLNTLEARGYPTEDILYYAADNYLSFNHTIWNQDSPNQKEKFNKIISFGDSLSDTDNMFNASNWNLPNKFLWFMGHFTNGKVWTEYLRDDLNKKLQTNITLYNWAVGCATGDEAYIVIPGLKQQIKSWIEYMKKAENYNPEKTLFTVEIGANDFIDHDRSITEVTDDFITGMNELIAHGATNFVVMTLPDFTKAPAFKWRSDKEYVQNKINTFNQNITTFINTISHNVNFITVFDTYTFLNDVIENPNKYGITNENESCLQIDEDTPINYISTHPIRPECLNADAAKHFVFWDRLHPTTHIHMLVADNIAANIIQ